MRVGRVVCSRGDRMATVIWSASCSSGVYREVGTEISPEDVRGPTRLAIVDDHELTRESLQNMLSDEPDIEIVGEAANGRQALSLGSRFRLDLILMDVRMPVMDGLEATKEIKQRYPEISVMMLTMHENPDYLLGALKAGAAGYVLKDAPHEEIVEAVRKVRNGESRPDAGVGPGRGVVVWRSQMKKAAGTLPQTYATWPIVTKASLAHHLTRMAGSKSVAGSVLKVAAGWALDPAPC